MTKAMEKLLKSEINFIRCWTEHGDEIGPMESLEDAKTQIDGMVNDYNGDDFPEGLKDPETMLMCWNFVVMDIRIQRAKKNDDEIRHFHPDWIEIKRPCSDPGLGSMWFGPDDLRDALRNARYDDAHIQMVLEALAEKAGKK